jgi:DNA repair protein RadC
LEDFTGVMIFRESEADYKKPNKELIQELIGVKDTEKLYGHFSNEYVALIASEEDYIKIGLSKTGARKLHIAKNIVPADINNAQITRSQDCYQYFKFMGLLNHEEFYFLPLTRNNVALCKPIQISKGGVSATVVDTKILFKKILEHNRVSSFIIAHNHPSGNINPSQDDITLTRKIKDAALLLDLKLLEHLIITIDGYYSFVDNSII